MDSPLSKRLKCQESVTPECYQVPVVLLDRLPDQLCALPPPTSLQRHNESDSDSLSSSNPENDLSDSDFLPSDDNSKRAKSPKLKKVTHRSRATKKTSPASQPVTTNDKKVDHSPMIVSCIFSHATNETNKVRPNLPDVEVKLDMEVLARKRPMRWLRGKVTEIVKKEDGRLKYKVSFDEGGRSLVSGYHLASISKPKLDELHVGARVVIQSQDDTLQYQPGILAELPGRKNRLRFLVFIDDHTPVYVSLQLLHLVCKPHENSLDDIQNSQHRDFLKQYMKNWPYPHLTQYRVGQCINAELQERMQECEVTEVDCSIMQVVFQENQKKEWIYRGSMRLEHMAKFFALKRQQDEEKSNKDNKDKNDQK